MNVYIINEILCGTAAILENFIRTSYPYLKFFEKTWKLMLFFTVKCWESADC